MISSKLLCINLFTLKRNASTSIGFIGVGNMGARMAANLIKKGQRLKVYDASPSAAKLIKGALICNSPEEVAIDSNIVITMLPNGHIVRHTILGENGVLKTISTNSYLVDCSTIEPKVSQDIFATAKNVGVNFLDAPVSGGITGAEAGTLTFMVGGEEEHVKLMEPILLQMGSKVLHCGQAGAGQISKLCNNLILGVSMIGTAEGMNLGIKLGLDPKVLASVINTSSGRCWSSDTYNPVPNVIEGVPSCKGYVGGFAVNLMAKDLGLAENAALNSETSVPLAAAAHQLYRTMICNGYNGKDFSSVYEFLRTKK